MDRELVFFRVQDLCRIASALPALLLATPLWAAGVLDPRGAIGAAEKEILIGSTVIMLVIVVPTMIATLAFAWWFRASNPQAQYRPDWEFSGAIELVTWSIPALTIILLGGVAWIGSHELDPAKPIASKAKPFEVQVVSLDWKWLFIYPEQRVASVNELTIPAGVPVHFSLTSASVMNAFFVPQLGSMLYTMNGMVSRLNLMADQPGTFAGLSSHFSGDGFANMHFVVTALDERAFADKMTAMKASGSMLDEASYVQLAKQSVQSAPTTYRDIDPALFDRIATLQVAPGPGPTAGANTHASAPLKVPTAATAAAHIHHAAP